MRRVAIVDDDLWVRTGRVAALNGLEDVSVVFDGDHRQALSRERWDDVDVVVVDAHDGGAGFDQFIGVRVVERVRRERTREQLRVVVLTGHAQNDLLRVRMAEAGGDVLYPHAAVCTVDDLLGVIDGSSPAPGDGEVAGIGLEASEGAAVNDAVRWAEEHLGEAALDPVSQKALPVSRRRLITARQRIGSLAPSSAPSGSAVERRLPAWRDVVAFLQRARGADRRTHP